MAAPCLVFGCSQLASLARTFGLFANLEGHRIAAMGTGASSFGHDIG